MLWAICCYPSAMAQRITRQYNNVSFAAALKDLNVAQDKYAINFVYNELEDFKVTKSIHNMSVPDAIRQLIGFYPIKMTQLGNTIIVECTQKAPTKMTGRIIDARHRPIEYANVCLLNARDSSFITGGTTNEDGQFVIPCEENAAIVKVSCVGYTTVCHTYGTGAIGTIALKEATISLQKVVVKGHHKIYKTDGTNLIVDIQRSSLSDFGNADEVVAQLPTVSGSDGSYTVFGRGRAEVYIGNRRLRNITMAPAALLGRLSENKGLYPINQHHPAGQSLDSPIKTRQFSSLLCHQRERSLSYQHRCLGTLCQPEYDAHLPVALQC